MNRHLHRPFHSRITFLSVLRTGRATCGNFAWRQHVPSLAHVETRSYHIYRNLRCILVSIRAVLHYFYRHPRGIGVHQGSVGTWRNSRVSRHDGSVHNPLTPGECRRFLINDQCSLLLGGGGRAPTAFKPMSFGKLMAESGSVSLNQSSRCCSVRSVNCRSNRKQ